MLVENMTLREMMDFKPSDLDMAMLPLDVVVYIKVSIVSADAQKNYDFIRYLFTYGDMNEYFKDTGDTLFYDFDGRSNAMHRFVTVFELYSLYNYANVSEYLQEVLTFYSHDADVLIDFYTHDDRQYRLSNLDGIVKLEEMHSKSAS